LLTRDVPDDYYYWRIQSDELALTVKLADLADNSDPARLSRVAEPKQSQLRAKYRKAYTSLGSPTPPQAGGAPKPRRSNTRRR
jgi:hypothetical protein